MLYSEFITILRAEAKDLARPMHNDFTGDGSTSLFVVTDAPILESSYYVKVDGAQKTEGSDYTIDRELGLITFAVAPADKKAVTIDYKYVHLTNYSWIQVINDILKDMEGSFWREVSDPTTLTSEADALTYNCPANCIDVINVFYKSSSSSDAWNMLSDYCNWRYSKDLNQILLGKAFFTAGYPMKVDYLKGYTPGTLITSTLDIQTKYEPVLKLGCMWRYYDYRLADRVETTTKVSKERTVTPLQNIQALSQHYYKLYLKEKGRNKPTKPMRILTNNKPNGGTP
jgi:hypothetical protein